MSKEIHKKTLPQYFQAVRKWEKTFEIRKDEDDIQVGDILILEEWDGEYTGQVERRKVGYVLRNVPGYGLKEGHCIIGFAHDVALIVENLELILKAEKSICLNADFNDRTLEAMCADAKSEGRIAGMRYAIDIVKYGGVKVE